MDVRKFDRGDQERSGIGAEELMVAWTDDHSKLTHLERGGDGVRWQEDRAPLTILFVGGNGSFMSKGYLTLYRSHILCESGSGGVRDSGSHRGGRRGAKHEDIRSASNTPSVSGVYGELDFTEDSAVCRRREGDKASFSKVFDGTMETFNLAIAMRGVRR